MKRNIIVLLMVLCGLLTQAQSHSYAVHRKGYFFDAGVAFGGHFPKSGPKAMLEVFTTHGYQFSNTFSLGAGIATYSTETLNIYMQFRFNLRNINESKSHYTYIALRGGYSWSTWTGDQWGDDKGPIIDPRFGWSFYTPKANLRWSIFAAPSLYQFHFIPKAGLSFEF